MNTSRTGGWGTIGLSVVWGVSVLLMLAGGSVTAVVISKAILQQSTATFFAGLAIGTLTHLCLCCIFVFQIGLFNTARPSFAREKRSISLQAWAFGVLYGLAGAALVLRGLRSQFSGTGVDSTVEVWLGVPSLAVWAGLMLLHRFRKRSPSAPS